MSNLDKDKVLEEFSAAYKKANGKAPKVEDSNGWYSVDDGKNLRLAQLDEWRQELEGKGTKSTKADTKKPAKSGAKAAKAPKAAKPASSKSKSKSASSSGVTAKELWLQKLAEDARDCRLPRGFPAE